MSSITHNVISNATGILTVPSTKKEKEISSTVEPEQRIELDLLGYEIEMMEEIETMDPYEQHMCAYLALCVEEKFLQNIKQSTKSKCTICAEVISSTDSKINDELLAMKGDSRQPSASTLKVVIFANHVIKKMSAEHYQGNNFNSVSKTICENLDIDDLYGNFHIAHSVEDGTTTLEHKKRFISEIVSTFMTMKSKNIGKKITEEERGELIRFRRKRNYILAGQ